jgi:phospholipase/carboxylesterase
MSHRYLILLALVGLLACEARSAPEPPARPEPPAQPAQPSKPTPTAVASSSATREPAAVTEYELGGMHYLLMHTGGARADATLPLVLAIHGLGDRPRRFVGVAAEFQLPARVVIPRGLTPHGNGFSWFNIRGLDAERMASGVKAAADRLADLLSELQKKHPTRGKAIVTGFSQGGMLSFALAVTHPEQIRTAIPLAGWLPEGLRPIRAPAQAPVIVALHGDADQVLPIGPTRDAVAALRTAGFDVQLSEYPGVAHTLSAGMRRELFRQLALAMQRANSGG